jgi:hypothetical protein
MKHKVKCGVARKSSERGTAKEMKEAVTAALKRRGEAPWSFGRAKKKP